jgi:hypothetical protein
MGNRPLSQNHCPHLHRRRVKLDRYLHRLESQGSFLPFCSPLPLAFYSTILATHTWTGSLRIPPLANFYSLHLHQQHLLLHEQLRHFLLFQPKEKPVVWIFWCLVFRTKIFSRTQGHLFLLQSGLGLDSCRKPLHSF